MSNQTVQDQVIPSPGISEGTGIDYTTNYRNYMESLGQSNYIRAFNIPMQDIVSLSDFTESPSVRAYLGMSTAGDVSTLKLVLVPVQANGANGIDILSIPVPDGSGGVIQQSSIYDLTSPCPQYCDVQSPLFQ